MSTLNTETILLETLASGIDPTTGFQLSEKSKYHNRDIKRALFKVINYLSNPKINRDVTCEDRIKMQQVNIAEGKAKNAQLRWGANERQELLRDHYNGLSIAQLCNLYERNIRGIETSLEMAAIPQDSEHESLDFFRNLRNGSK